MESRPVVPAGDLNRLRQINELAVLDVVRGGGPMRLSEIADQTSLTRATVREVVSGLQDKGWVAAEAPVVAGRGRPAQRFRFRTEAGCVLGLDIGAHSIDAAVADLGGAILGHAHQRPTARTPASERLALVGRAVRESIADAGITADQVWVTVAGSTGRLAPDGSVLASAAIPDWSGLNLVDRLAPLTPGTLVVENDVRLATLAEQRIGAARGARDVVVVQAGRRVGMGLVLDGQLRLGAGGVAGDVSRFSALNCEYAIDYIGRCATLPSGGTTGDHVQDVLIAAREGQSAAVDAVRQYARVVAEAVATTVSLLDPEMVVLTGTMAAAAAIVVPILVAEIKLRCLRTPAVAASEFGSTAVMYGAIQKGVGHLIDTLLGAGNNAVPPLQPLSDRSHVDGPGARWVSLRVDGSMSS
ncbi:ROK family transcriptional regulator [Actinocrispum wychmicini]|uniref:Putative NBD/HSP70 family sugar kinase n=1 Tax=Actinocrispum wychmicini TaxID=1213861 RepID=A0A4R2JCV2_9PSEU|nr:ROK family transcriptional regulator [Actinocrispum wychmicini]TCO55872.1 putative NBD/HSP70 family sugar kinase [Actinocrispum wychmicini]